MIRIAFLGAGRVAQHYKYIFNSGMVNGFTVVGVCDIKRNLARELAEHWQCGVYGTLSEMIESTEPDLVLVLTPSGMHYQHARSVLELGCHVLVEKPAIMIPDQAKFLKKIAHKRGKMLGVAFQNRFNPAVIGLRTALLNGRFGRITTATIRMRWCRFQSYYEDGWHGTWAQDGGVINQQAIHHVDALNWLVGPVEAVCATMGNRLNLLEAEDTMVAVLRFANGGLGTLEATTAARPSDIEASLSIVGEGGVAVIGGVALNKVETWQFVDKLPQDEMIPTENSRDVPNGYGLSHGALLQHTIDRLKAGSLEAPIPLEDCVSTTKLIHALYASVETGGWIKLSGRSLSMRLGH